MTTTASNVQAKLTALYARITLATLIESFEATDDMMDKPEMPTVRGWMMEEMERRNPEAFEAWMMDEACPPARQYFLP